jgi:AraC-like DNA-binding protein
MDWFTESKDETATRYLQPLQREEAVLPAIYDETTEWGQAVIGHLTKVQLLFDSSDPAREMRIKAELYLIFADLITHGQWKRKDQAKTVDNDTIDRLKSVVAYVDDHCGQPITVSQLAAHAGMSSGHFSRVFKTFMRKSPMEYVNQYRIQRAANLLQSSSITVAEAALEVGIDNFSYFSKRFKESYACTPMQFRKKFRSL